MDDVQKPQQGEYKTKIHEENAYIPSISSSMRINSENMAQHLFNILQLEVDAYEANSQGSFDDDKCMMDHEIIDYATQLDLPIFVSIDGSLDDKGIATTNVSIVAPDL